MYTLDLNGILNSTLSIYKYAFFFYFFLSHTYIVRILKKTAGQ